MRSIVFALLSAFVLAAPAHAAPDSSQAEPREQLDGLIRFLAAKEYRHVGKVLYNPSLASPQTVVHDIVLPAGRCYVVAALAPATADLNLTVLAPNGRAIAHDVRRDAHPNVRFCTRYAGRHALRLQMARGSGGYYVAVFEGPAHVNPRVASFFDGREPRPEPQVKAAKIDRATRARYDALSRALVAEGYGTVGPIQGLDLGSARAREFKLNLRPDRCYVFAVLAGQGVNEANATILTDEDEEVAKGEASARDSIVRFCPPHEDEFSLRAQILKGRGAIFVAGFQRATDGARARKEPKAQVIAATSTESAPLEEAYAVRAANLTARGYVVLGSTSRGEIEQGERGRYGFELESGKCYAMLAVGGEGVASMRFQAEDEDGGLLDRDVESGRAAVVRFCPEATGKVYAVVHVTHGSGPVMVGAFAWPRGTRGPFGLAGVMYVRLAEMMQLLELEGYEPSLDFSPQRGTLDREGTKETHPVRLEGGRCYALVAVGDEHITDLGLELVKDGQVIVTDLSRNAFPSVRHCPTEGGELEFVVTAKRGRGDYFYQLFERAPE